MEKKFTMEKFRGDPGGFQQIRYEPLPSGKIIAFGIAGTDLSVMQFDQPIDFDKESDLLIEKNGNSKENLAFEYVPTYGFNQVDSDQQKWFIF